MVRISSLDHILAPSSIKALTCVSCNKAGGGEQAHIYIYIYLYMCMYLMSKQIEKATMTISFFVFFEVIAIYY